MQCAAHRNGTRGAVAVVGIDIERDGVADRLPYRARCGQRRIVSRIGVLLADRHAHLDCLEAFTQHFRRAAGGLVRGHVAPLAEVAAEAAIDRETRAFLAPQQRPDRQAEQFAAQVPQRAIDPGKRLTGKAARTKLVHLVIGLRPQPVAIEHVGAFVDLREFAADHFGHQLAARMPRLAPAGGAVVSGELDEDGARDGESLDLGDARAAGVGGEQGQGRGQCRPRRADPSQNPAPVNACRHNVPPPVCGACPDRAGNPRSAPPTTPRPSAAPAP